MILVLFVIVYVIIGALLLSIFMWTGGNKNIRDFYEYIGLGDSFNSSDEYGLLAFCFAILWPIILTVFLFATLFAYPKWQYERKWSKNKKEKTPKKDPKE